MKVLLPILDQLAPRILTQVCRDPNSAAYGCFDRNWWHYKIRDFPSVILQQGGYFLWLLGRMDGWRDQQAALTKLARASAFFWNERAKRRGAFEEYYPWEQGYPPLAFSTLAVMKLAAEGVVEKTIIKDGARIAARQLLGRFEHQAANQQVAGLAALAWIRKVFPDMASDGEFQRLKTRTLALQDEEGWFVEYGGPDLGYLSVTMDCLWDLYDATGDRDFVDAAQKALNFIAPFVALTGASIGMHNARNTDYIVPYGIARFAAEKSALAAGLLATLYGNVASPNHFLHATDDRYLCHYIGHSLARAAVLGVDADAAPLLAKDAVFDHSGHALVASDIRLLVSLKKGGVLTACRGHHSVSDFGWVVTRGAEQFVNHWWSDAWTWIRDGNVFTVKGRLVPHSEHISTPAKHILLRLASYALGQGLIKRLKGRLIFQEKQSPYAIERQIYLEKNSVRIADRITGLPPGAQVVRAPRASKRHVASADSFHAEDLNLDRGVQSRMTQRLERGEFFAEATHLFP